MDYERVFHRLVESALLCHTRRARLICIVASLIRDDSIDPPRCRSSLYVVISQAMSRLCIPPSRLTGCSVQCAACIGL
ncbi:hypothetical protein BJX99DRAFT_240194 [Aspergillus californicus]